MGPLGGTELLVLFLIILLVFGPSQIPKMARGLGQAMREFRKAQREIGDEMTREEPPPPASKPPDSKPIN
jgi:sec-independent protein translocase protein TatA